MKKLLLSLFLLSGVYIQAQIKFETLIMDNGLRYPKAVIPGNKAAQDSINRIIEATLADVKAQDFCAGDFGFVQKGMFVQIHMLCNCIDMEHSEHRYLFFNFNEGKLVPEYELFDEKQRDAALKYLQGKIASYKSSIAACGTAFSGMSDKASYNDFDIRLGADGVEIRPKETDACEKSALIVPWKDLQSYLKLNFI